MSHLNSSFDSGFSTDFSTLIPDSLIVNEKNYWCSMFAAVLECMHYQTNLRSDRPQNLSSYPNWTISGFSATFGLSSFTNLQDAIYNHGFEYFFRRYLEEKSGSLLVQNLINFIEQIYNVNLKQFPYFIVRTCGADKIGFDSSNFEKSRVLVPTLSNTYNPQYHPCVHSDLCITFFYDLDNMDIENSISIYGEVEGANGQKMLVPPYWEGNDYRKKHKHPASLFGIGCINEYSTVLKKSLGINQSGIYAHPVKSFNTFKSVILFEKKHPIVSNFYDAFNFLISLSHNGKNTYLYTNWPSSFFEVASFIKDSRETNVLDLIHLLIQNGFSEGISHGQNRINNPLYSTVNMDIGNPL